jgi:hypothetical protein
MIDSIGLFGFREPSLSPQAIPAAKFAKELISQTVAGLRLTKQ